MEFLILNKNSNYLDHTHNLKFSFNLNKNLKILSTKKVISYNIKNKKILFFGIIEGYYLNGKLNKTNSIKKILSIFSKLNLRQIIDNIEGRFTLISSQNDNLEIFQDKFAKYDLFYSKNKNRIFLSNNFKIIVKQGYDRIDSNSAALLLNTYSARPAKKDTIFNNIKRLGVDECINIKGRKFITLSKIFKPNKSEDYSSSGPKTIEKIKDYFEIFINYLKNNDKEKNKIIFMSSGFDSSYLTALLTKINNRKNIFGVTCILKFNSRSGAYNRFEIDRVNKLSKFYGIKNYFVDVNFKDNFEQMSEEISNISAKRMLFNHTASFMHHTLSKKSKQLNLSNSVYSGEISDGMHNMGFSQLISSTEHPSHGFREYADKKTNYLYSPTFQNLILENTYQKDSIFKEYIKKNNYKIKGKKFKNYSEVVQEIFYNIFLSNKRLVLDSTKPNIFTNNLFKSYKKYFNENYFQNVKIKKSEEFYSSIQYLYNSFHWQGSTVSSMSHYPVENNLNMHFPFWNLEIQKFTDKMPENWGRGLELRPTKFPLKESFKKYLNYPAYLETGPHSYMYDINQFESSETELLINPKTKTYMLKILKKYHPAEFLSNKDFNHNLINDVIKKYQRGSEEYIFKNAIMIWNLYSFSKMMHDLDL